jgi:hypothetical protein
MIELEGPLRAHRRPLHAGRDGAKVFGLNSTEHATCAA